MGPEHMILNLISRRPTLLAVMLLVVTACTSVEGGVGESPTSSVTPTTAASASSSTVLATTTVPAPRLGDELLVNGGFEEGDLNPDGWEMTVDDPGHVGEWVDDPEGGRVLRVEAPLVEGAPWPQLVSTEPFRVDSGTSYSIELRARTDGFGLLFSAVAFQDAAGSDITGMGPGSLAVETDVWSAQSYLVTAPEGAVSARVIFRLALNTSMTDETPLSVYLDDVSVREVLG